MNAHQRRRQRRRTPAPTGCGKQGHSGTTPYPDLLCMDGYMRDADADGYDPNVSCLPCASCDPAGHEAWMRELAEDELPDGLTLGDKGALLYECRHCGGDREWYGEADQFDAATHMQCGGSPYCLP